IWACMAAAAKSAMPGTNMSLNGVRTAPPQPPIIADFAALPLERCMRSPRSAIIPAGGRGVEMIAAKLIELIEIHADRLTADVTRDLVTNERTRGFRAVRPQDLEQRIFQIFHHLGNWIGEPRSRSVEAEFGDWGRRRFDQGIPLSEIVYAVIVLKQHMARYILDNGLVDASFPRIDSDYVL